MGTFQLSEVGEYIPQNVQENDFLNARLESDTYGIYYSVKFEGDAETFLLQAKKPPVEGQPEWGMIEKSKSGKSLRFKRVKREDSPQGSSSTSNAGENKYQRDVTALSLDVYRVVANIRGLPENAEDSARFWDIVMSHTNELLSMIEKVRSGSQEVAVPTPSASPIKSQENSSPGAAAQSLGNTYRNRAVTANDEPEYDESDMP